jgi:hypothetical protein
MFGEFNKLKSTQSDLLYYTDKASKQTHRHVVCLLGKTGYFYECSGGHEFAAVEDMPTKGEGYIFDI